MFNVCIDQYLERLACFNQSEVEALATPVDTIIHKRVVDGHELANQKLDAFLSSNATQVRANVVQLAGAEA